MPRTYKTLKAAREDGFRPRQPEDHGGEQVVVKGHRLVRNAQEAMSRTAWSRLGYRPKPGVRPHATVTYRVRYSHATYDVYRDDQVVPKPTTSSSPPVTVPILQALWTLNRRAKRCRDLASRHYRAGHHPFAVRFSQEKRRIYDLKSQLLSWLLADGLLATAGFHMFPDGNWAEVLVGAGYSFHRPCPPQDGCKFKRVEGIESKPKTASEARLRDAMHTIKAYLDGKPRVTVYGWPSKRQDHAWPVLDHAGEEGQYDPTEEEV